MNKPILFLILMLSASYASLIFTMDIDRSGFASVTLSLENEGEAEVILPDDARNFRIVGGSYSIVNNTAYIESGRTGFATFSFSSDALTTKTASGWKAVVFPPERAGTSIYMPAYSTIKNTSPQPKRIYSEDSRTFIEMDYAKTVIVSYRLEDQPLPSLKTDLPWPYIIGLMISAGAIILNLRGRMQGARPKEKKPTLGMTPGKKEMMETFNENDLLIVNFLLDCRGKSKRNVLERKTIISKSSLSMALRRLEKRRIIEVDRTATTHYVKLSDYFLRL